MTPSQISGTSFRVRVENRAERTLDRHFWAFTAAFVLLLLTCGLLQDARKKMWIDELYTLHMARLHGPRAIVQATLEGCDGAPPLYAMAVGALLPYIPNEALAVRLPSTLCYCGLILLLLQFCRRRLPALYCFIAALLVCFASQTYLTEGRAYGGILCCAAGALLCWQTASDGRHRVLSIGLPAFLLSVMTALHYYAIFFLVALVVAEIFRWRASGKMDVAPLVAASAAVVAVLALHYPLIAADGKFQEHPRVSANWQGAAFTYFQYAKIWLPLVLLAMYPNKPKPEPTNLTEREWAAVWTFLFLPTAVMATATLVTHVFHFRYTLWALPGNAVFVAALLHRRLPAKAIAGLSTLVVLFSLVALSEVHGLRDVPVLMDGQAVVEALAQTPTGSEPIVVASHHVFMELSYYAEPQVRNRLVYPLSRELDLRYFGNDTGSLIMGALWHRANLNIVDYTTVLAWYPRFILAAEPSEYLPRHLRSEGYSVVPIGSSKRTILYQVEGRRN